ncbi:DUF2092 domain-containing protein [Variovorax sp. LARHSF232]
MTPTKFSTVLCAALLLGACGTSPPAATPGTPPASSASPSASAAAAAPQSTAQKNAVDPAAVQALKAMGAALQSLRRYEVSLDLTGERVLQDGQKLMHSAQADLQVAQPNRLRAHTATPMAQRVMYYDGKKVTLQFPDANYYSAVDFSGTVGDLVGRLKSNYGVELPAADLFAWGTPAAPFDNLQSAMNAGQAVVGGKLCDHYAFRQAGIDWQIWLSTGSNPLPQKLVVTNLGDDARPQSTTLFHWNLKPAFADSSFTFVPRSGAKSIDMVPVKKQ